MSNAVDKRPILLIEGNNNYLAGTELVKSNSQYRTALFYIVDYSRIISIDCIGHRETTAAP